MFVPRLVVDSVKSHVSVWQYVLMHEPSGRLLHHPTMRHDIFLVFCCPIRIDQMSCGPQSVLVYSHHDDSIRPGAWLTRFFFDANFQCDSLTIKCSD